MRRILDYSRRDRPPPPFTIIGSIGQRLQGVSQSGALTDTGPRTGTITQGLQGVGQSGVLIDVPTTPIKVGTIGQMLYPVSQAATGATTGDRTGTIAQALQGVGQSGTLTDTPASGHVGSIGQPLQGVTQAGTLSRIGLRQGQIAQPLLGVQQSGALVDTPGPIIHTGSIAQTLMAVRQSGTLTVQGTRTGTIAQPLAGVRQSGTLVDTPVHTYPPSVVTKGLQSVWDLYGKAGTNAPLTLTPALNPGSFPAGTSLGRDPQGQTGVIITKSATFANWDFTGFSVIVNGNIAVGFTNCKFAYKAGQIDSLVLGAGAPIVTAAHCEVNGLNSARPPVGLGGVILNNGGTWQSSYTKWDDPGFITTSPNPSTFDHDYFTSPGINAPAGSHLECIFFRSGANQVSNCLFDVSNGAGLVPNPGMTTLIFVDSLVGNTSANIFNNIFIGLTDTFTPNAVVCTQQGTPPHASSAVVNNNVASKGLYEYFLYRTGTTMTGSGNIDYNTSANAPITFSPGD